MSYSNPNLDIDITDPSTDIDDLLNNNDIEKQLMSMKMERQKLINLVNKECADLFDSRPAVVKKLDRLEWEDSQVKRLASMKANELEIEMKESNKSLDNVDQELLEIHDRVEKLKAELYADVSGSGYTYEEQEQKMRNMKAKELFKLAKKQDIKKDSMSNLEAGSFEDRFIDVSNNTGASISTDDKSTSKHTTKNSVFHISDVYDEVSDLKDTEQNARQRLPHPVNNETKNG